MFNIPLQISRNFRLHEFIRASETLDGVDFEPLFVYLLPWLQEIRDAVGEPVKITSFHRATKGVPNSTHFRSMAVDFTIPGWWNNSVVFNQLNPLLEKLDPNIRYKIYMETRHEKPFVHMDCGRIYHPDKYPEWQENEYII